jgi:hypothetical protein
VVKEQLELKVAAGAGMEELELLHQWLVAVLAAVPVEGGMCDAAVHGCFAPTGWLLSRVHYNYQERQCSCCALRWCVVRLSGCH